MHTNPSDRPIEAVRLDGGRPSLDFVNTIHDRGALPAEDYIGTPERFVAWCVRAGVLEPEEARRIDVDARALKDAHRLREHLYALFTACIAGRAPPQASVAELDRWLHRAWAHLALDPSAPRCLSWSEDTLDAHRPLERIALSALEVLREPERRRLKRCATRGRCGWLFFDDSKNGRRRWCSMEICGTAAKMRRFRGR